MTNESAPTERWEAGLTKLGNSGGFDTHTWVVRSISIIERVNMTTGTSRLESRHGFLQICELDQPRRIPTHSIGSYNHSCGGDSITVDRDCYVTYAALPARLWHGQCGDVIWSKLTPKPNQ